jgi:NAD(P)-dependent dehydrogenase (short-subunit alcohol dehydrogenase family)
MTLRSLVAGAVPGRHRRLWSPLNPPLRDWERLRVWIIGGSSGIGLATATALHERGAIVHLSARNAQALQAFADAHPGSIALPADACDLQQVRGSCRQILQNGPLDLVMYCAGYYRPLRATAFDLAEARRHQEVNYVGALNVLDAVLPGILGRGGHISLVSSVAGYRALPNSLAYGPTKAALIQLAESLHLDLADLDIGVSVINPGFVDTPLTAQNRFHMPALLTPAQAAAEIVRGWECGRFEIHFPRRFTLPLKLLRLLPFRLHEALVKRWTGL